MMNHPPCLICNSGVHWTTTFPYAFLMLYLTSDLLFVSFLLCFYLAGHAFLKLYRPDKTCFLIDDATFFVFSASVFFPILFMDFHLISFMIALSNISIYLSIVSRHVCS